ncbi:hypothetical protein Tco_0836369 [Tanacetum coccineum]
MNMQPMITELRYSAQTSDWIDVLCYYCRRAASIDRKFARQINRLRGEMAVACENRMTLVEELEDLQDLERQMELRAVEKELFVQKLLRNVPF